MRSRTRLLALAVVAAGFWVLVFDIWYWWGSFHADPTHNDFVFYYLGGLIGRTHGWSHLYDLDLQDSLYASLLGAAGAPNLHFVNPPPLAWLVTPLTYLPVQAAYVVWTLANLVAFAGAWWLAAPGRGLVRVAHLLGACALFPVVWSFINGEVVILLALLAAGIARLLRAERDAAAGLLLGLTLVLKPTLVFALPPALAAAGRWRAAAWSGGAAGLLATVSVLSLGEDGVGRYRGLVALSQADPLSAAMTVRGLLGGGWLALAAEVLLAAAALVVAARARPDASRAVTAGLLGSFLATPYLHPYDLVVLLVAAWLQVGERAGGLLIAWLLVGAATAELVGAGIPYPVVVFELGWLGLLWLGADRSGISWPGRAAAARSSPRSG